MSWVVILVINFRKSSFAKNLNWKKGLLIGIIFITVIGVIPMIIAGIQEALFGYPRWSEILIIPLFIPILLLDLFFRPEKNFGFGGIITLTIISYLLYGGLGAFIGFVFERFLPSNNEEKE